MLSNRLAPSRSVRVAVHTLAPLLILLSIVSPAGRAFAQIKPRFVVGVDTSGSMLWDLSGNTTYGDGVGRPTINGDSASLVVDGVYYGCGTTAGLDRDCDGLPNDSKIAVAKRAIRKMVLGFGDVEWSLTKFRQIHALNKRCLTYDGTSSCTHQSYGNPQCNSGTVDNSGCVSAVAATCRPGSGSVTSMRRWASGNFNGCINYGFNLDGQGNEVSCLGADVLVGFTGFGAFTAMDNRPALLRWIDNVETAFDSGTTAGNFCNHSATGDCELRPGGSTPLASLITTSGQYAQSIQSGDSSASCRQYSSIILSDGAETCGGNPNQAAFDLAFPGQGTCNPASIPNGTPAVRTYVVGISINSNEQTSLNQIAACGGTGSAYFASSEAQLSAALADIVSRSIRTETCNGRDDDCDTKIDEGIPAGQSGSAAQPDALFCDGEGKRTQAQNDQVRLLPTYNNVAQNASITQRVVCGRVNDTCDNAGVDDDCDGKLDEDAQNLTSCGTCPGATDTCDGRDNDCDGTIDETPNSGRPYSVCPTQCTSDIPCGSSIGECRAGVYPCVNGVLNTSTCVGQTLPATEICDEKDNDCNGVVDDPSVLARACTTPYGSTGICLPGTQLCAKPSLGEHADAMGYRTDNTGKPICSGQVLPEDREQCDLLDHDCDGDPFTCTQNTCVIKPQPEHVGDPCGQGVGSCKGVLVCNTMSNPPSLVCNATGGTDEICDGLDNDCDGNVDENLASGGPCGSSVGECKTGTYKCAPDGTQVCTGDVKPGSELCDSLDNDCDGKVDEELGVGDSCGSMVGICREGNQTCLNGRTVCSGAVAPQVETCDCDDNDCDGKVDETSTDSPICPGGSTCRSCQCVLPCEPTVEFGSPCPQGKAPVTENGSCYCVGERCNATTCSKQTIELMGEVQCAPNSKLVSPCQCKNNDCSFACSGVTCGDGLVCDPTDGRCRQSSCLLPQFPCPTGQRCGLLDGTFQCIEDACAGVSCGSDEACRDGTCVKSCASVSCGSSDRCVDGACLQYACAAVSCSGVQVCDPGNGSCVENRCVSLVCADGKVCDPLSGTCNEDPCLKVRCPGTEVCDSETGQCRPRCDGGEVLCGESCENPQASRTHCGARGDCQGDNAGESCGTSKVCSQGTCSTSCAKGWVACNGVCIDPLRDATYCGAVGDCQGANSGQACSGGKTCMSGFCQARVTSPTKGTDNVSGVVATGGGGCACSVGPGAASQPGDGSTRVALSGLCLLALCFVARRPRLRRRLVRDAAGLWLTLGAVLFALLGGGCELKPLCLDCGKDASSPLDSGAPVDARVPLLDANVIIPNKPDSGSLDAGDGSMMMQGDAARPDAGCVSVELCNNVDDDCDGTVDEDADPSAGNIDYQTNASHCGGCGKACNIVHAYNKCVAGSCTIDRTSGDKGCDVGYQDLDEDAANGCEYRCIRSSEEDKLCDQQDNDCDGRIDENVQLASDAQNCGACGLRCTFAHAPDGASCADKECILDDTHCEDGFRNVDKRQATGCEYRCAVWPTTDEVCNAKDDDCDGKVDEEVSAASDSRIGVACGSTEGECELGATTCVQGAPTCTGAVTPISELCDSKDNDCDGVADDDFNTNTDIANCGACGQACLLNANVVNGHAVLACQSGACKIGACVGDFADTNGDYRDGCETPCTITGNEVCDGVDNDCDGMIDDAVTAPSVVCALRETGVCAASQMTINALRNVGPLCSNGTLSCDPARANIAGFESPEVSCDSIDNDCDGKIDEMIPQVGQPCTRGQGACQTSGVNVCNDMAMNGYSCNAANPPAGTDEACDGVDNDCNGTVDDFGVPSASSNISGMSVVNLGSNVLITAYEASRPNATGSSEGTQTSKPCSAAGRLPWANVTWTEAQAACCALNADGNCQAASKGWRLCDASTWQTACKGSAGTCTWGYSNTGAAPCTHASNVTTYAGVCLGSETSVSCSGGASQCATTTGSGSFAQCRAVTSGGSVFDMSGNLKEWTATSPTAGNYELRGGSYNNLESGRTCEFNFTVGSTGSRLPNVGFRCCFYP